MKRSTSRILTSHTGSLPRVAGLRDLFAAKAAGKPVDPEVFATTVRQAVNEIVRLQADAGVSVINDGEESKPGFNRYVMERLSGFGGEYDPMSTSLEMRDFPEYFGRPAAAGRRARRQGAIGPLAWKDFAPVETDIANLKAATRGVNIEEVFMSSASPGTISYTFPNHYYPDREKYLEAAANIMKREYEAIAKAGFIVQLDSPDLGFHSNVWPDLTIPEFRKMIAQNLEAINIATRDISPEQVRIHICWGATEGPHNHDVGLKDIIDLVLKSRPHGVTVAAANGQHEHEWKVWKDHKLPAGKVIVPGVIDSTTNIIEHPETVAERITRFASVLGRDNMIAGVDCGYGTNAMMDQVDPKIVWTKFKAQSEGAALASKELWRK